MHPRQFIMLMVIPTIIFLAIIPPFYGSHSHPYTHQSLGGDA